MRDFFSRLKLPTLLGLAIIFAGIGAGVFLTLREQIFLSQASPDITAQNITLANLSDDSVTISFQTNTPAASFITYGLNSPNESTALDDRDPTSPQSHYMHFITLKNLLPRTVYQYKIVTGRITSETLQFKTASPLSSQTGFSPIIGSVLNGDKPLSEGVVYLSVADAQVQASQVKDSGNFLIPISQIRGADPSNLFPLAEDALAKITVISPEGEASALFKLKNVENQLPPIKLGENLDLTFSSPIQDLEKYDLNSDGQINSADNAIILQNFGKNPKERKADLNLDGVVDQKDLDLLLAQINKSANN